MIIFMFGAAIFQWEKFYQSKNKFFLNSTLALATPIIGEHKRNYMNALRTKKKELQGINSHK